MTSINRKFLIFSLHGLAIYSYIRSYKLHSALMHRENNLSTTVTPTIDDESLHSNLMHTKYNVEQDKALVEIRKNEASVEDMNLSLPVQVQPTVETCNISLNEMAISMAKYSAPLGSPTWRKIKRVLSQAKYYHIPEQQNNIKIFKDSTKKLMEMLDGYGLVRIKNETINSDIVLNDTILLEYSIYSHDIHPKHCTGSKCNTIPRISLQTEQIRAMRWAADFIRQCSSSPNCIIWDFSRINYDWAKTHLNSSSSESIMIVPLLFHDRLQDMYPSGEDELLPYHDRTLDMSFFGLITQRRREFQRRYILGGDNATLSPYKVQYRKLMFLGPQVDAYKKSKICLVLHAFMSDSAGEYHRVSDFKRFGCIPVMESSSDIETQRTLAACAGIVFADYDHLASTVVSVLNNLDKTDASVLRRNQLKVDNWWRHGIQWSSFLETILGPRESKEQG